MRALIGTTAGVMACMAGMATANPVIDGQLGSDSYGPALFVQNQPTSYGNNVAGVGGSSGNPAAVTTGMEIAIPLSAIGNPNPAAGIKLVGFLNNGGHSFLSNQVLGGVPANSNHLMEPRNVNFQTLGETQTLTVFPQNRAAAPVIDGQLDGGLGGYYGTLLFTQTNYTSFGNSTLGQVGPANGSEIDGLYAVVSGGVLYIMLTGNNWDFNKPCLFFDTIPGGQNRLLFGNSNQGNLSRMSENPSGAGNGLTFEAGFDADFYVTAGGGNNPYILFVDYATIPTDPVATPPAQAFVGSNASASGTMTPGDVGAPSIIVTNDNSNTQGVTGIPSNVSTPSPDFAFGSEIDAVYGKVEGGVLFMLVTGNLETTFQKLDLFFDVDAAEGQAQLLGTNVDLEFNGLNRLGAGGNGTAGAGNGVAFDTGFAADYFLSVTNGNVPVETYANAATLRTDGALFSSGFVLDYSAFDGGLKSANNPIDFSGTYADDQDFSSADPINTDGGPRQTQIQGVPVGGLISVAINNSNVLGVTGTDGTPSVAGAAAVTTGVEFSIALAELGWDGGAIRVAGFIAGGGHGDVSNQVIGGLPTPIGQTFAPGLGEPTLVDFSTIAGNQFVIIPTGPSCGSTDFDGDGDEGTDADIEAFFLVIGGGACPTGTCGSVDFDGDGDEGTDADIEAFFRVIGGGPCQL